MTAQTIFDLMTPALILDRARLDANAARMREKVRALGVTLRPHVKTSKSIDVLRVLAGGADVPITVSTLVEARYFFDHGVRDILYAVGIAPVKLPEVAELIRAGCKLRIILDTPEAADAVHSFTEAEAVPIEVPIEIDSDGHRAGVRPDDPLLVDIGRRLGPHLVGVMTPTRARLTLAAALSSSKPWPSRSARLRSQRRSGFAKRVSNARSSASARRLRSTMPTISKA
jgi:D-serine deaminase-like pyridoxal phosphate-dependent protein